MVRQNVGQQIRSETLQLIEGWIKSNKENGKLAPDVREALKRRICIYIGATEKKAEEYLKILGV